MIVGCTMQWVSYCYAQSEDFCVGTRMIMLCALDHAWYLKCKLDVCSAVVETIN